MLIFNILPVFVGSFEQILVVEDVEVVSSFPQVVDPNVLTQA
jgi:hypothetical protein